MKFIYFFLFFSATILTSEERVLVSVAPYATMVHELAPETTVQLLVPAGYSSHTYEPTPKQVLSASKAKIWFIVGELFEERILQAIHSEDSAIVIVDLRDGLELLDDSCHDHDHHTHQHAADPHIWMSPKMMQVQVLHITKSLEQVFPEWEKQINANSKLLIAKLEKLDAEIRTILSKKKGATVFVSHPAYGYFCREYNLKQVAIEFEGKDPTPKQITQLVQTLKEQNVKTIFTQNQYSTKAATLIANEVGAKVVQLDPYAENYFESMLQIATSFASGAAP